MLSICKSSCVMFRRRRTTEKCLSECISLSVGCDVSDERLH